MTMSSLKWIVPIAAACAALGGCANLGPKENKSYNLSGFTKVMASAGMNVELKQGPYSVTAEGPSRGWDSIVIEVEGDTLRLGRRMQFGLWGNHGHYVVTVSAPNIAEITSSSGADVKVDRMTFADLKVHLSSGADMKASGACKSLNLDISSGADFDGGDLKCEAVNASASSGADAIVFASTSAHGHASSGADIKVLGRPADFNREEGSGGSVKTSGSL